VGRGRRQSPRCCRPSGSLSEFAPFAAYPRCSVDPVTRPQVKARSVKLGARVGPLSPNESSEQTDLEPGRGGVHFRKLACRSDAVGEDLACGFVEGFAGPRTIDRPTT